MRVIVAILVGALVLALGGFVLLGTSRTESALADAREALAVGRYADAEEGFARAEHAARYPSMLPGIGARTRAAIKAGEAAVSYWQGAYEDVVPEENDPASALSQDNLELQLIIANALFRAAQEEAPAEDRESFLAALDTGIDAYLAVLRDAPDSGDAAFNYEYLSRLRREILAGDREVPGLDDTEGTLGQQGGPPPDPEAGQEFKIYIPLESEELDRKGAGAGKGGPRKRKG